MECFDRLWSTATAGRHSHGSEDGRALVHIFKENCLNEIDIHIYVKVVHVAISYLIPSV